MINPSEYIDKIREKFNECRESGLDRFSVEWGHFSRQMNMQLKTDTDLANETALKSRYNYVFMYWIELSKCLQQHFPDLTKANLVKQQALSMDPSAFDIPESNRVMLALGSR